MQRAEKYDVIVIGGGPAGMMAAGCAAERGKRVLLLEKNGRLGKKLDITGGGRCNITHAEFDAHALLSNYGDAGKFLYSPLSQFDVQHTFDFFARRGLPLSIEARKRAFPHTQQAPDVTRALEAYLSETGVVVKTRSPVRELRAAKERITEAVCDRSAYAADAFILATGGVSHPETGSSGEGLSWLSKLGHTVHAPTPSIVPLQVEDAWVRKLAGQSLSDVKLVFFSEGKRVFAKRGPLLFTHFGLSGPTILNCAKEVGDLLQAGAVSCAIDLFPDKNIAEVDTILLAGIDANKNKRFINVLSEIVPRGIANAAFSLLALPYPDIKAHSFAKDDRKRLAHLLKAMPVAVVGLMGFDRAVVSDGGVALHEVDTKTMRSRLFSNLYLVGDVLHVSRPSGGFSLQLCWTTGFVAGTTA